MNTIVCLLPGLAIAVFSVGIIMLVTNFFLAK